MMREKILSMVLCLMGSVSMQAQDRAGGLTTVPALQQLAGQLLKGRQGSIVAIRPSTGEVLCMASKSLDGSRFNREITGIFAPGSTFKVAQALVLCSENIVSREAQFVCNGGFDLGSTHVGCHRHVSPLSMTDAIGQSCNTWFCQAFMAMIGDTGQYGSHWAAMNTWHDYMVSMGFGHTLGIDMNNEAAGLIPDGKWMSDRYGDSWDESRVLYLGMGQGALTVTPLQLCNLAATVANRGYYHTPYIRQSSARNHPERYAERHWTKATRAAYDLVVQGMRAAVRSGTCRGIDTRAFAICGKTGTVENRGEDHSVFIGFAPMDRPQIAVAVFIENGGFGADVAAPMAARIMKAYINR